MMCCEEAMSKAVLDSPRLIGSTVLGSLIDAELSCPRVAMCLPQHFTLAVRSVPRSTRGR